MTAADVRKCRNHHQSWWTPTRFAGVTVMWCRLCGRRWDS